MIYLEKINVNNSDIAYYKNNEKDYISLTDMARQKDERIEIIIQNWLRIE